MVISLFFNSKNNNIQRFITNWHQKEEKENKKEKNRKINYIKKELKKDTILHIHMYTYISK